MSDTHSAPVKSIGANDSGVRAPSVKGWVRWLSVVLSVPVLTLCVLLPIAHGEKVYRSLFRFRDEYAQQGFWGVIVACRWIAWLTVFVAGAQLAAVTSLVLRPRRRIVIASYIALAMLVLLFFVWAYYMAPSASFVDAVRRPAGARR